MITSEEIFERIQYYQQQAIKEGTFVPVIAIARDLKVKVYRGPMPQNMSGRIFCEEDGIYKIWVNSEHSGVRQRFTIAHELAHLALHKARIDELSSLQRSNNQDTNRIAAHPDMTYEDEVQANSLAAQFLMPEELIKKFQSAGLEKKEIAKRLKVSETALSIRMKTVAIRNVLETIDSKLSMIDYEPPIYMPITSDWILDPSKFGTTLGEAFQIDMKEQRLHWWGTINATAFKDVLSVNATVKEKSGNEALVDFTLRCKDLDRKEIFVEATLKFDLDKKLLVASSIP